jgi:hypothetical protein
VAAQKPADILFLVSAAFSFAAAAFFPALVLGIFWKRATKWGAVLGMIAGLGITFYYMVHHQVWLRGVFGVTSPVELWWGILPISAGVFGVPLGFAVIIIVSLFAPAPGRRCRSWSSTCATRTSRRRRDGPDLRHARGAAAAVAPLAGPSGRPEGPFCCLRGQRLPVPERADPASAGLYSWAFPLPHPLLSCGGRFGAASNPGIHEECSCVITKSSC